MTKKPESSGDAPLAIDVISDVMCPWCFIGQENLQRALKIAGEIETEIRWRPYQLDATLPPEGKDRQAYLSDKFGGEAKAATIYGRIEQAGKQAGIDFKFDKIKVSPNTLDAHRLLRWAAGVGAETQAKVADKLFRSYFLDGQNIGDHGVLKDIAVSAGMDGVIVGDLLASDADKEEVRSEIAHAGQIGVTGVPVFIFAGKYAVSGAQPPEVLANAIRQTAAEIAEINQYRTDSGNGSDDH